MLIRWYSPNDTNADDENIWYIRAAIFVFVFVFQNIHTHTMTMKERLRFGQWFGLVMTFLNNKEDLFIYSQAFSFVFVVVGGKD